jgi:hypothetical protein
MIQTLFVASLAASLGILLYLRLREVPPPRQAMLRGLLELTIPLTLTSGVFAMLQWWVHSVANSVTAASTIRQIELAIRTIRNGYIERLVLPAFAQFLIIAAIVLAGALSAKVRSAGVLGRFKTGTRWMTRAQIAFTLLASFTFFGAAQATDARNAQVRLGEDISAIERRYDGVFAAADEALAKAAVNELLSDPAWEPALDQLAETIANQQSTDHEMALARMSVTSQPFSNLRDFKVTAEQIPSAEERAGFLRRERTTALPRRETWSRAEADRLKRDVEAVRRETVTELVGAIADIGREALAKRIVAEYFAGSAAEGLAAVVLDASVFYDFRHVVAEGTASLVERVLGGGERLTTAFASIVSKVRADAATLAPRTAETARQTYASRAIASRERLTAAREVHRDTLQEYRAAADQQAAREQQKLVDRLTRPLDSELGVAAKSLLERLLETGEPAMQRIARVRKFEQEFWFPSLTVSLLASKERELGGREIFNDLVERRVARLLRTEPYNPRPFSTMSLADSETREMWEQNKRDFVLGKLSEGATTIEPHEWDRAYTVFKASPKVRAVVETRRIEIQRRARPRARK